MSNHLANENSPYLLQHMQNPVDWYPWSPEALDKARLEDKPIFLSIGYAACHWCHVMAHESFENPETAAIMNQHFVNIKVDREERPDLDSLYMNAVVAITGQGGWPMSVFLTPQGEPFFGGTYFPPVRRYNMPAFREILISVSEAWKNERQQIVESGRNLISHLHRAIYPSYPRSSNELSLQILSQATKILEQNYDWENGGWGQAPKFPQPMAINFLLGRAALGDDNAREVAEHVLHCMARGGMYDVVGGGFARYSTDNQWLVPHFEKMLYDNAQLARAYLHGYLVCGNPAFRSICTETLDFVERELMDSEGGFYSSLDADSEGEEGKFYLWTLQEIQDALDDEFKTTLFITAYGINQAGNFEGRTVLQRALDDTQLAKQFKLEPSQVQELLSKCHQRLLVNRTRRVRPATDDKVLVSWNALMLITFAEAGRYLSRNDYIETARRNVTFLLNQLTHNKHPVESDSEIFLLRSWRRGSARQPAFLEDYAGLILGLVALYQSDSDHSWYTTAKRLTKSMVAHFIDAQGGFFDTRDDHEELIMRPKDTQDNATPSGGAMACLALLQMTSLSGNGAWRDLAEKTLGGMQSQLSQYPTAYSYWLSALAFAIGPVKEVAILGDEKDFQMQALIKAARSIYHPNMVVASSGFPPPQFAPELLHNRLLFNGQPSAYVCQNFVCKLPVNSAEELALQLGINSRL